MKYHGFEIQADPGMEGARRGIIFPSARILFVSPAMKSLLDSGEDSWIDNLEVLDAEKHILKAMGFTQPLTVTPNQDG